MVHCDEFLISVAYGQIVLPDRSLSIGQKLVENATSEKFQEAIGDDFQTMWIVISAGIFRPF